MSNPFKLRPDIGITREGAHLLRMTHGERMREPSSSKTKDASENWTEETAALAKATTDPKED